MIDGVEVLTSEMVRVSADLDELIGAGIIFAVFALLLFYFLVLCIKEKFGLLTLVCIVAVSLFTFASGKMFKMAFNPVYEERYMVKFEENIPTKFLQDYEILENKGNNIYIVREKGNE